MVALRNAGRKVAQGAGNREPKIDWLAARSAFVKRGTSLTAWAESKGWFRQQVYYAVTGLRRGPRYQEILATLYKEISRQ